MTRPASLGKVQEIKIVTQEQKNIESVRVYGAGNGSGSADGSDLGSGRILSRPMELGPDRTAQVQASRSGPPQMGRTVIRALRQSSWERSMG